MAINNIWIYCFFALCSWNVAKGCTWMKTGDNGSQSNFKVVSNHSISMLQQMGDEVTRDNMNDPFPHKQYKHAEQLKDEERIIFIYETINDVKKLYISGKYDAIWWDQKKLDTFQLDLDRQTFELHQCIQIQKSEGSHSVRRLNMKMRQHFKELHHLLKNKNYSADGWEIVRSVVLEHLRRLDLLASSYRHSSKNSP